MHLLNDTLSSYNKVDISEQKVLFVGNLQKLLRLLFSVNSSVT